MTGASPIPRPSRLMRGLSFVFRFVILLIITAYREANRDS